MAVAFKVRIQVQEGERASEKDHGVFHRRVRKGFGAELQQTAGNL